MCYCFVNLFHVVTFWWKIMYVAMTLTLMEDIALIRNYWRNMVRLVGAEYKNTIMMLSIIVFVGCMKLADALWIACPRMILDVCVAFPQLGFQS